MDGSRRWISGVGGQLILGAGVSVLVVLLVVAALRLTSASSPAVGPPAAAATSEEMSSMDEAMSNPASGAAGSGSAHGAMAHGGPVDPGLAAFTAPAAAVGGAPLDPTVENGVKVFSLEASVIGWSILPDVQVTAYAFNRQVPGPQIRIQQGDRVRVVVTNSLPDPTSVHWHGLEVPNELDGAAGVTQAPIEPGDTYTYEFTVRQAGTFFYHSHQQADRQQALGLYGAFIVDPAPDMATDRPDYDSELVVQLQEWTVKNGDTYPAMPADGLLPNYFTINGKAYPATEPVRVRLGDRLLVRLIGTSAGFAHPIHIHGGPFEIVATDGNPVPTGAGLLKDTIDVAPGERYDLIWVARQPGAWLLHCHVLHHTTNNGAETQGGGGMTTLIEVQ
ncbi:MAG: copper oxidase [Phycisphaerales bacterium]|nr:copper oxidase [Phycisphaerales bacterium]